MDKVIGAIIVVPAIALLGMVAVGLVVVLGGFLALLLSVIYAVFAVIFGF